MEIHLKVIGSLLILLSIAHFFFPNYFKWKKDLSSLELINRQMFYSHTFFVVLTIFLMGLFSLMYSDEIITENLGRIVALGFAIFWTLRLIIQIFGYSSKLWKGKTFETSIHILFTCFWLYMSVVYWAIYL